MKQNHPSSASRFRRNTSGRLVILIILSALVAMILMSATSELAGIGAMAYHRLDGTLSVDVLHPDGSVDHSDSNFFSPAHKGDVIRITVPLPKEETQENAALCFNFYNSILQVTCGDEPLYTYGEDRIRAGRQIGHLSIAVPVPEEAWGAALIITALPQENNSTSNIHDVYLMPAVDARLYPLVNNQFDFLIFLTLIVFAEGALVVFGLARLFGFHTSQGFFLALFLVSVSGWYLGYQGLFYLFSNNIPLCANIEYQALYIFPIPFLAYIRREDLPPRSKQILTGLEVVFIVTLVAITALYFSPMDVKYIDFLNPERLLLFLALILAMVLLLRAPKEGQDLSEKVLRYGLVATMGVAALETIRITLNSVTTLAARSRFVQLYIHINFSRLMILVFLLVLLSSFFLRQIDQMRITTERRQLARLAFTDLLTGIPNRQDCERNTDAMENADIQTCAVLFLDANDLKLANDKYSHEIGDELLRQMANALRRAMAGHRGFFGRYGGDEFVACLYDGRDAEAVRQAFFSEIETANLEKRLPFPISVACGMATYQELAETADHAPTMQELIHCADERMYEDKQRIKQCAGHRRSII